MYIDPVVDSGCGKHDSPYVYGRGVCGAVVEEAAAGDAETGEAGEEGEEEAGGSGIGE